MEINTPMAHAAFLKDIDQAKATFRKTVNKARTTARATLRAKGGETLRATTMGTFNTTVDEARVVLNDTVDKAAVSYLTT